MRRLLRAFGIDRGQPVDQILDQELQKKLKESPKVLLPQISCTQSDREEWLLIKQEFLLRNMLHEQIPFVKEWLIKQRNDALQPFQDAHKIWTGGCNLKPPLENIKETLTTYENQFERRKREELDGN